MKRAAILRAVTCAVVASLPFIQSSVAHGRDYYFSPTGADTNSGTSAAAPFASIPRLNSLDLNPGDNVYLQGGTTFNGNIVLDAADTATNSSGAVSGAPINITSYGGGQAVINAGNGTGLLAQDNGNLEISNLTLKGTGQRYDSSQGRYVYDNTGHGIQFLNDQTNNVKQQHIAVNNVNVSGFGQCGIAITATTGTAGYDGVTIKNVNTFQNQGAGLSAWGDYNNANRNSFNNVYIAQTRAYDNYGEDNQPTHGHTGSGIVLGQVTNGVIEKSVAYGNGVRCDSTKGGPVAIWAWDSANVVIQKNEAYKNGTGAQQDGGGFDLDGGTINSVMQYNYSHDNEGAGYLICQFTGARTFSGNKVRYNISQNDGRANGYGAIHTFGDTDNTDVYNNTVYMEPAPKSDLRPDGAPPAAIKFRSWTGSNLRFFNNLLMVEGDTDANTADPVLLTINDGTGLTFKRNAYWDDGAAGTFNSKDPAAIYLSWLNDPALADAGGGGTLNNADLLAALSQYTLQDGSPLIDQALDLKSSYNIDMGGSDFFGIARQGKAYDIGAAEFIGVQPPAIIPEPAATALLGLGLLIARSRRRPG